MTYLSHLPMFIDSKCILENRKKIIIIRIFDQLSVEKTVINKKKTEKTVIVNCAV